MRNILLLALLLMNYCHPRNMESKKVKYFIDIWSSDYSMAYTVFYHIDNDSLIIKTISGIEGEGTKTLMEKGLKENERNQISDFLSLFNINSLKEKYINPLVEDGDKIKIKLQIGDNVKSVEISNFYQKDIGELIEVVNQIAGKDFKIEYRNK